MQALKNQQPKNQTWIFNDSGLKFFVLRNKNLFKFRLYNVFSHQWYQSQQKQLLRISEQTIKAAFNLKVSQVAYELIKISQVQLNLKFKVKLQFLSCQFYEDILLKKLEINKDLIQKLLLSQLQEQINIVDKKINQQIQSVGKNKTLEKASFNSINKTLWEVQIEEGLYLFKLSGMYISQRLYNGQQEYYDDGGMDMGNQQSKQTQGLIVEVYKGQNKINVVRAEKPYFNYSYEYPYNLSMIIQINKKEEVKFIISNESNLIMNNNLLTFFSVCKAE